MMSIIYRVPVPFRNMERVNSWLVDKDYVIKISDKTFIKDFETGLPRKLVYKWFLDKSNNGEIKIKYKNKIYSARVFEKHISPEIRVKGLPTFKFEDNTIIQSIVLDVNFQSSYEKIASIKGFSKLDFPLIKFVYKNGVFEIFVCGSKNEYNRQLIEEISCTNDYINSFVHEQLNRRVILSEDIVNGFDNKFQKKINTYTEQLLTGYLGECSVVEYEKNALKEIDSLFDESLILHSSLENDSLGYDIKSFDKDGNIKYIEVKTTTGDINTPFFVTQNELNFSKNNPLSYFLYRIYNYNSKEKLIHFFILKGDIEEQINKSPISFSATRK